MTIGIIAATEGEAVLIVRSLSSKKNLTLQHKPFFSGTLDGKTRAVICISGAGKANAAHGTTLLLDHFGPPGRIYIIGVAGAYPGSGLLIGDVAAADKEFYGDEGIITDSGFHSIDELGVPFISAFPMLVPEAFKDIKTKGNFVSVSTCTGTLKAALDMERRFNALCENMEGAAVAHVCALNNIPVSEIRGISNIVGNRRALPLDPGDIRVAAENAQKVLLKTLSQL
jgi:futalosine hydrolase